MSTCQGSMYDDFGLYSMDKVKQHIQFKLLAAAHSSNAERLGASQLWESVPDDILWNILVRLPLATQCRFRCVCTKWKRLLLEISYAAGQPLRPTCTYRSGGDFSYDCYFCSESGKWFPLPFQRRLQIVGYWVLMATDSGLFCYVNLERRRWEILVCNPMTGSYVKIFPEHQEPGLEQLRFLHFIVNLETQPFKLILLTPNAIVSFDSRTLEWRRFQDDNQAFPDLPRVICSKPGFVWKGKIYRSVGLSPGYLALDLESGTWSVLKDINFPSDCDASQYYHLESWKDQVILAQLHPNQEDPIRVWMMRDGPNATALTWEKIPIEVPDEMKILVNELRQCLSHGYDYICFTTWRTHRWVKYTFKTKSWQVMPRPGNGDADKDDFICGLEWANFEPQTFMNPEADNHSFRFDGSGFLYHPDVDVQIIHLISDFVSEGYHTDGSAVGDNHSDDLNAEALNPMIVSKGFDLEPWAPRMRWGCAGQIFRIVLADGRRRMHRMGMSRA